MPARIDDVWGGRTPFAVGHSVDEDDILARVNATTVAEQQ